jgi:hypothetical protein
MAATTPRTRARRPVAVIVAAFLALGAVGATAGAALGAVGGVADGPYPAHHHRGDDDSQRFPRPVR